jgi:hypothetical protein
MTSAGRASDFVENRRDVAQKSDALLLGLP